jgi:CubicO group peptidase (beta-lactamase class C family)
MNRELFTAAAAMTLLTACQPGTQPLPFAGEPEVDAIFAEFDDHSPGCALGVIRNGDFEYRRGYGMANLELAVPIDAETIFRIGSTSKQFTAMTVLLLEEAGSLTLQDDIRDYLPELPDFGETITIADLIHHTSGFRDYLELMWVAGYRDEDYYDAPELYRVLTLQRALNFPPGERFLYSNSGYFLLGEIVRRVAGEPLSAVAEERIFGPLGMTETHFHDDITRIVPHRASGYARNADGSFGISMTTLPIIGDGGVYTSVNELLAWDRNYYDNRLGEGGSALIERWLEQGVLDDGTVLPYAAGIRVDEYRGQRTVSHGGAFVGYRAEMLRFPEQMFSVVVLCNVAQANPSELALRVADFYLAEVLDPAVEATETEPEAPEAPIDDFPLPVAELRKYEGTYVSRELDATYRVEIREGRLRWEIPGRMGAFLRPEAEDRFRSEDPYAPGETAPLVLRFVRTPRGDMGGFLLDAGRVENLWFERTD